MKLEEVRIYTICKAQEFLLHRLLWNIEDAELWREGDKRQTWEAVLQQNHIVVRLTTNKI